MNKNIDPRTLKITDMRFAHVDGSPKHVTLLKLYTNQGLVGFGEVRDAASQTYAAMLKSRLLGENPCDVDRLFRRVRQFGFHGRQGGGVSGVEVALLDLAGKAWNVPVYQLLGGKHRDSVRVYCDTDVEGRHTGADMGQALLKRMESGYTFLKMDLGIGLLWDEPGALCAPTGLIEETRRYSPSAVQAARGSMERREAAGRAYQLSTVPHHATGIRLTERGLDLLENYVSEVRGRIGCEIPLAIDHFGHVCVEDCVRFARRMEKYNLAWIEDMVPWQYTDQLARLKRSCNVPVATGEDIYLLEGFKTLIDRDAVSVVHPDVLTAGGIMETKRIGDYACDNGVAVALHMAESPVGCMAAVHAAAAMPQILAMEFHSSDVAWWRDIAKGLPDPLIKDGFITVPDAPGLGIEALDDKVIAAHPHPDFPGLWEDTSKWDEEWSNDKLWS